MSLLVSLLMAPAVLYLTFRLYSIGNQCFRENQILKRTLPIIVISFYLFPIAGIADFYITNGIDVLAYPKPLLYWFWFGLVLVYQLATWFIIADVIKLGTRFFSCDKNRIAQIHARAALFLFVIIFCFTGWKMYHDTTQIKTQEVTLSVKGLPKSLHDFKIVHITDIQGDQYTGTEEIAGYIKKVNKQQPDLIIFTGDLISYGTDYIKQSAKELGKAKATYGTFAVVGDHDYWAGVDRVKQALTQEGIPLLQEENHTITVDSATNVSITGITEVYSKQADPRDVDSLTSTSTGTLKIHASHQIDDFLISKAQQNSYNLMLAGHTHGGQIHVPFMGMSFSASERETEYIKGLYWDKDLPINVNNGLGFTLAPIRYGAPPNVSIITLERES